MFCWSQAKTLDPKIPRTLRQSDGVYDLIKKSRANFTHFRSSLHDRLHLSDGKTEHRGDR